MPVWERVSDPTLRTILGRPRLVLAVADDPIPARWAAERARDLNRDEFEANLSDERMKLLEARYGQMT